jgi:sulfite reductase beta subunit-like hemoprotein
MPSSQTPALRPSIAGNAPAVLREIDAFERSVRLFQAGRTPEAVFLEHRLRFGVYGQRQDGVHMMRSKLPLGLISPDTLDAFADISQTLGGGVAHLTTRQDIQIHFVELNDSPEVMRLLAAVEGTFREACGNVVRNVVSSPVSGVLPNEAWDVTAHGFALAKFLLRHPDGQNLGRKFKISLASAEDTRFNLALIHDIGGTAVHHADGRPGFKIHVGGGLGPVPHTAKLLYDFIPADELLPLSLAILRVFAEHGEKKNRARSRLKFLVAAFGIETFRDTVEAERAKLTADDLAAARLEAPQIWTDTPLHPPGSAPIEAPNDAAAQWLRTNVTAQAQAGYHVVKVRVHQGDLSPDQLRGLAQILRTHTGDTGRIGVDQSFYIRWVPTDRLLAVRTALSALDLGETRAGGLGDTVTCPGADTCKLGVTRPRSVAREVQPTLDRLAAHPRLEGLTIKISGCPNACAQHQIADIGLFGAARTVGGATAPHYVLLLGGVAGGKGAGERPGDGFGRVIVKVPARRVGEVVERLCTLYLEGAHFDEAFSAWTRRLGRTPLKQALQSCLSLPHPDFEPEAFREYGQSELFAIRRGQGECAGALVEPSAFAIAEADREMDEVVDRLEEGADAAIIVPLAISAMTHAARALLASDDKHLHRPAEIRAAFKADFYDAARIFEGVGHYYLAATEAQPPVFEGERLQRLVVEAGLFVEEGHSILGRVGRPETRSEGQPKSLQP